MPKTAWEARVGMLLDPERSADFVWSYKPHDSAFYGGQPRVDYLACDRVGRFWMIEVKTAGKGRKSITLERELSPGQIAALDAVAASSVGIALLAVGHETTLHVFDWRKLRWALEIAKASGSMTLIGFDQAAFSFEWTGPKTWTRDLYGAYNDLLTTASSARVILPTHMPASGIPLPSALVVRRPGPPPGIPPMMPPSDELYRNARPEASPSISKPKGDSIRMRRRRLLSAPSLSRPPE